MIIKHQDGLSKLAIDTRVDGHILLVGVAGDAHKTSTMIRIAEKYKEAGYKIVVMMDNKDALDFARMGLPAYQKFQLDLLKEQGEPLESHKIQILHPATLTIPNHKIIKTQFYTNPIKNLSEPEIHFIIGSQDTGSTKLITNTINIIKDSDNFYEFMQLMGRNLNAKKQSIKGISVDAPDENNFNIRLGSGSDKKDVKDILESFKMFGSKYETPFLTPKSYTLNLNWNEILNQQDTITIFSDRFIPFGNRKLRLYFILNRIENIMNALSKGGIRHPILLIFDEISFIIPYRPVGYQEITSEEFKNMYRIIRNMGESKGTSTISATQEYFSVQEQVMESFTEIYIGKLGGIKQLERLSKASSYSSLEKDAIKILKPGYYLKKGKEIDNPFEALVPQCSLTDQKIPITEMFEKYNPEMIERPEPLIAQLKKDLKTWQEESLHTAKEDMKTEAERISKERKRKNEEKNATKKVEEVKAELKQAKNESQDKNFDRILELLKEKDMNGLSNRQIANRIGISHTIVNSINKITTLINQAWTLEDLQLRYTNIKPERITKIYNQWNKTIVKPQKIESGNEQETTQTTPEKTEAGKDNTF